MFERTQDRSLRRATRAGATMGSVVLGLSTFLLLWATEPRSDPVAEALLWRADAAKRTLSYEGELVSEDMVRGHTIRWRSRLMHHANGWTRVEILGPTTHAGTILLFGEDEQFVYHPRRERWHRGANGEPEDRLDLLLTNYRATLGERETVAGWPGRCVIIEAKAARRPREVRCIATESGLVVKIVRWNWRGRRVKHRMFRWLRMGVDLEEGLFRQPAIDPERSDTGTADDAPEAPVFAPARPAWVPVGFQLVGERVGRRRGAKVSITRYSDGLAALTLLVKQRLPDGQEGTDEGSNGAYGKPNAQGGKGRPESHRRSFITWEDAQFRYTLVGDIPEAELRRVAQSVPTVRLARAR